MSTGDGISIGFPIVRIDSVVTSKTVVDAHSVTIVIEFSPLSPAKAAPVHRMTGHGTEAQKRLLILSSRIISDEMKN